MAVFVKPLGFLSHAKPQAIHKAKEHIKYIEANREKHRNNPDLFNAKEDNINRKEFFKRIEDQPRNIRDITIHKFVLTMSQDEKDRLNIDLRELARDTMAAFETKIGQRLDFLCGIHDDLGHPHVHLAIRGRDLDGKKVEIYKLQISQLKEVAEKEKIRQAERNIGKDQTRDIMKELDKEHGQKRPYQEQEREYQSPISSKNDFSKTMFNIVDQLIKQSQRDIERAKRQAWKEDEREQEKNRNKGRGMDR